MNQEINNPYAPPVAAVSDPETHSENSGVLIPGGRRVSVGRGASWIGDGWVIFKQSPGAWIGAVIVGFIATLILSIAVAALSFFIPLANMFSLVLFVPLFGGMMIACDRQRLNGQLNLGDMFSGFTEKFAPLAIIGLVVSGLLVLGMFVISKVTGANLLATNPKENIGFLFATGLITGAQVFVAVSAATIWGLMVYNTLWYSPALVAFHGMSPLKAMGTSFQVSLRNILPWLLYSIIVFILMIFATLPILLGWLVLGPIMWGSLYASYRDVFIQE